MDRHVRKAEVEADLPVRTLRGNRLSRAFSAVRRVAVEHAVAEEYDAGFDGGEFSGPAHWRAQAREQREAAGALGYTVDSLLDEVAARTCGRWVFFNGHATGEEE